MRVVVTGASGFLGWHTRARLRAVSQHEVRAISRPQWHALSTELSNCDAVIHIAGVNRGNDIDVHDGNIALANDLASAIRSAPKPLTVVYANTIHAGQNNAYGTGKQKAAEILRRAVAVNGGVFSDIVLPNLFGEHGRPHYNSFVATFVTQLARGERPDIADRPIHLLHAQRAAQGLIDGLTGAHASRTPTGRATSVREVYDVLERQNRVYSTGDIPELRDSFEVELFNTLRARRFEMQPTIPLIKRADHRGSLVETARIHGGAGQTFLSTTRPGSASRGEHYHLRKIERFVVVRGTARVSLRRLFTSRVFDFDVDSDTPVAIDMPTLWTHNLTNTGKDDLVTMFWTNELFDEDDPDTYPEKVR